MQISGYLTVHERYHDISRCCPYVGGSLGTTTTERNTMPKPNPEQRVEVPVAGGGTLVLVAGEQALFEEITNDLISDAKRILALMKKHVKKDYVNEEFREKWNTPPIPGVEGDLLDAFLWVIGHERERMFAEMTKNKQAGCWAAHRP
jgi:hypothetical protein